MPAPDAAQRAAPGNIRPNGDGTGFLVIVLTRIKLREDSVLADPRAAGKPRLPIEQRRLAEVPGELLRVECMRCFRVVEIQRLDAVKLHGPHAVRKDIGQRLLDDGCQHRTGRHEEDGCWPNWTAQFSEKLHFIQCTE